MDPKIFIFCEECIFCGACEVWCPPALFQPTADETCYEVSDPEQCRKYPCQRDCIDICPIDAIVGML